MTAENTHDLDGIELADAVESIRNQLVEAAARATAARSPSPSGTSRWSSPSNCARRPRRAAR
ncbi:hypothetical protein SMICM304S_02913 [Streptomyces microflavus]